MITLLIARCLIISLKIIMKWIENFSFSMQKKTS